MTLSVKLQSNVVSLVASSWESNFAGMAKRYVTHLTVRLSTFFSLFLSFSLSHLRSAV